MAGQRYENVRQHRLRANPLELVSERMHQKVRIIACLALLVRTSMEAEGAPANTPAALCATANKELRADSQLASEVAAVFGKTDFTGTGSDCLYPLKALRYASADVCLLYTSPSPRDRQKSRMPSSA